MTPSARRVVTQPSQNRAVVTYMFADESPAFSLSSAPVPGCDKAWELEPGGGIFSGRSMRKTHTLDTKGGKGGESPPSFTFFKTLGTMVKDSPNRQNENPVP